MSTSNQNIDAKLNTILLAEILSNYDDVRRTKYHGKVVELTEDHNMMVMEAVRLRLGKIGIAQDIPILEHASLNDELHTAVQASTALMAINSVESVEALEKILQEFANSEITRDIQVQGIVSGIYQNWKDREFSQ